MIGSGRFNLSIIGTVVCYSAEKYFPNIHVWIPRKPHRPANLFDHRLFAHDGCHTHQMTFVIKPI